MLPVAGREWGVGALAPDLCRFTDEAAVLDALAASGALTNQSWSDPNVRPGVSICADIVSFHEPEVGTLVHEATAVLDGQVGVVLVFKQPGNLTEVRMYGTGEADPGTGGCPLLMKTSLHPGPADNALHDD